jgi:hypothetical protein
LYQQVSEYFIFVGNIGLADHREVLIIMWLKFALNSLF